MKIAIISPWTVSDTAVGGTERFVIDLAESLKKLGNEIDVYMLSGKSYNKNEINYININILKKDGYVEEKTLIDMYGDFSNEESYMRLASSLENLINVEQYDLIQLNSQLFLKAFKNKKRIFTIHTNPFEFCMVFGERAFETMIKIMKNESNNSTYYVAPSKFYKKNYEKLTDLHIDFISHAIDINRIKKDINIDEIYEKYKIDKEFKHILLPSRLEPVQKRPMLFMKSFAKIDKQERSKFEVICTGIDDQYKVYANEIEKYCKENDIRLKLIRFDYMYEAYSIADLVILPSQSESFGYSALESLTSGISTILNAIPTYIEISDGSRNAYIFDNTEEALLNELKKVIKLGFTRINQSSEWQNKYDLQKFGERYLKILNIESENVKNECYKSL